MKPIYYTIKGVIGNSNEYFIRYWRLDNTTVTLKWNSGNNITVTL